MRTLALAFGFLTSLTIASQMNSKKNFGGSHRVGGEAGERYESHSEYLRRRSQQHKSRPSNPIDVNGYSVRFPYTEPYPAQKAVMANFLKTLNATLPNNKGPAHKHSIALIEAPTGTGKTLALLTAALEWQKQAQLKPANAQNAETKDGNQPFDAFQAARPPSIADTASKSPGARQRTHERLMAMLASQPQNDSMLIDSLPLASDEPEGKDSVLTASTAADLDLSLPMNYNPTQSPPPSPIGRSASSSTVATTSTSSLEAADPEPAVGARRPLGSSLEAPIRLNDTEDASDDFLPAYKPRNKRKRKEVAHIEIAEERPEENLFDDEFLDDTPEPDSKRPKLNVDPPAEEARTAPKIFFASRTHAQLKKAIGELRRTYYRPVTAVLGSREHYCIHETISRSKNKNEDCKNLLSAGRNQANQVQADPGVNGQGQTVEEAAGLTAEVLKKGCIYHTNAEAMAHSSVLLPPSGDLQMWDIEDLVRLGRKMDGTPPLLPLNRSQLLTLPTACPYFASREIAQDAQLIFCPYVYLIDPVIRDAMKIDLTGHILIIDEAHNIDEVSRDAASTEFDYQQLSNLLNELREFKKTVEELQHEKRRFGRPKAPTNTANVDASKLDRNAKKELKFACLEKTLQLWAPALTLLTDLDAWLVNTADNKLARVSDKEQWRLVWQDKNLADVLTELKVDSKTGPHIYGAIMAGFEQYAQATENVEWVGIDPLTSPCLKLLESIGYLIKFMTTEGGKYLGDYRLIVDKFKHPPVPDKPYEWTTKICWWAMRGAVAMRPIVQSVRTLALVSGTLSPFPGLRSELGLDDPLDGAQPFVAHVSTPHVIDTRKQLLVQRLTRAPHPRNPKSTIELKLDYKSQESHELKDGIGTALLQIATNVPDGVLVFFSSYSLVHRFSERWKSTNIWTDLEKLKPIFVEPHQSDPREFVRVWNGYQQAILAKTGAIFFAVCRGKISEGMDFQDQFARAVVVIGIPFPHALDFKINQKKEFNNAVSAKNAAMLGGGAWYTLQAYRALNQAIGRVIRHSADYGAVILIDSRFSESSFSQLSKWVRTELKKDVGVPEMVAQLNAFFPSAKAAVRPANPTKSTKIEELDFILV